MREQRTRKQVHEVEIPMRGRRNRRSASNSLQFFARIEGTPDTDGHLRGANGIRWKVA